MQANEYAYALLDLEILARAKSKTVDRVYGYHLLEDIQSIKGRGRMPMIILDGQAECLNYVVRYLDKGASNFVAKPINGRALAKAVRRVVASRNGYNGNGQRLLPKTVPHSPPEPFAGGELTVYYNRIEFCGVEIPISGLMRRILTELNERRQTTSRYVAYSGRELADRVKCERGQSGIADAVLDLRDRSSQLLLDLAGIICGRQDIIQSGGSGYRYNEWITVRVATVSDVTNRGTANVPDVTDVPDAAKRRNRWILKQLETGVKLGASMVAERFRCSQRTAKRDLTRLRSTGEIEFVGPTRSGHYRRKR